MTGAIEKFVMRFKNALQSALAKLLVREKTKHVEDLLPNNQSPGLSSQQILANLPFFYDFYLFSNNMVIKN